MASDGATVSHNLARSSKARVRGANVTTVYFEHCSRRVYMKQLAAETGIPIMTLYQRWHRGDRDERLVRPCVPRSFSRNQLEQRSCQSDPS